MFDDFSDLSGRLTCAAGHPIKDWQTKSFACEMTRYYLFDGRLFVRDATTEGRFRIAEDGTLRQAIERSAVPVLRTIEVEVHTFCETCRPVLHAAKHSWNGGIDGRQVWCSYVLTFVRGALDGVTPGRLETREGIAREMRANGDTVIEDDSPAGVAHWAAQERRR